MERWCMPGVILRKIDSITPTLVDEPLTVEEPSGALLDAFVLVNWLLWCRVIQYKNHGYESSLTLISTSTRSRRRIRAAPRRNPLPAYEPATPSAARPKPYIHCQMLVLEGEVGCSQQ